MIVDWDKPANNGLDIKGFNIEVANNQNSSFHKIDICGSDRNILSCKIPMQILREEPFSLLDDQDIILRASAYNNVGSGKTKKSQNVTSIYGAPPVVGYPAIQIFNFTKV